MSNKTARDEILASIRSGAASARAPSGADSPPDGAPVADSGDQERMDRETLIADFMRYAAEEAATSERVAGPADIPGAVVRYLRAHDLPLRAIAAGEVVAGGPDWSATPDLDIARGPLRPDGDTVVTGCFAGLAEAGAVVTVSSDGYPNEVHFLAATHIVVVPADRIVVEYEAFWSVVEKQFGADLPRSINWIVGPSRTADLGVPSKLGAHGPARLHLIIMDKGENDQT